MNIYYKKLIKPSIIICTLLFSIVSMGDYSIGVGYKPKYSDSFMSFDYVNPESKHNIISYYECDKCKTWYEVYTDKKEKK